VRSGILERIPYAFMLVANGDMRRTPDLLLDVILTRALQIRAANRRRSTKDHWVTESDSAIFLKSLNDILCQRSLTYIALSYPWL
jgi:hypothetical protein